VDWEYGGVGEPLFDLASFVCQNESCAQDRDALLRAWGANFDDSPGRLAAACIAFDYVQWLWYGLSVARGRDSDGEYSARAAAVHSRLLAVR
jgi:thiamine kinase-like enzyme